MVVARTKAHGGAKRVASLVVFLVHGSCSTGVVRRKCMLYFWRSKTGIYGLVLAVNSESDGMTETSVGCGLSNGGNEKKGINSLKLQKRRPYFMWPSFFFFFFFAGFGKGDRPSIQV